MTRESKLALIIGFVLVLVVGVLVSDHFSQASTMALDVQQPEEDALGAVANLGPREKRGLDNSIKNAMGDREIASSNPSNHHPVTIHNGSDRSSILDRAAQEVKQRINTTEFPKAALYEEKNRIQKPILLPSRSHDPRATYRVVAGDTLIAIARRTLGTGDRWQEIHELNADVLGPDAILKIGMTLKLPIGTKTNEAKRSTRSAHARSSGTSYTIRSGDTLGEISMKLLGTFRRADEIVKLNGLESANDIRVGMKLKIPAR